MHGPGRPGPGGPGPGMFGGGIFGPGGSAWGPDFKFPGPVSPARGGSVASTGDSFSGWYTSSKVNFKFNSIQVAENTGSKTRGFFSAARMFTAGPMHFSSFSARVEAAQSDYDDKRITDEVCKYRKLKAADKYHSYLYKLGYYTKEQFVYEIVNFAQEIKAWGEDEYICQQVLEESKVKLTEEELDLNRFKQKVQR